MTNERVSNFATELAQMALASQRLPEVEQTLSEVRNDLNNAYGTIQRLELKLIDRAQQIESLHSTIRTLEVSRDAAELRFLECDDAKGTLERTLRNLVGEAQGVLQAVAPFTPMPPKVAAEGSPAEVGVASITATELAMATGESATHPIGGTEESGALASTEATPGPFASPDATPHSDASFDGVGESAADPTLTIHSVDGTDASPANVPSESAASQTSVPSSEGVSVPSDPTLASAMGDAPTTSAPQCATPTPDASLPSGPYTGKRYRDFPTYVSYYDWLAGGGTDEGYNPF